MYVFSSLIYLHLKLTTMLKKVYLLSHSLVTRTNVLEPSPVGTYEDINDAMKDMIKWTNEQSNTNVYFRYSISEIYYQEKGV